MNRIISSNKHNIKAGALYYAIFVSFIVFALCGFIIVAAYLNRTIIQHTEIIKQLQNNAENMVIAKVYGNLDIRMFPKCLEGTYAADNDTSSFFESYKWGAFSIAKAQFRFKNDTITKIALVGNTYKKDSLIALYLEEKDNYLTFMGTANVKGNCYLPRLGYKNSLSIYNNQNKEPIENGVIKKSERTLPNFDEHYTKQTYLHLLEKCMGLKNTINYSATIKNDSLYNSFSLSTINILNTDNELHINKSIKGNIRIISTQLVRIKKDAMLNHILIYAPIIIVEKGFKGSVQLFATDSIHIEERCSLQFPSFVAIIPHSSHKYDRNRYLIIDTSSSISGGIMAIPPIDSKDSQIILSNSTSIIGQVYCAGSMQLQGKITGSVYASFLFSESASGNIGNTLVNGVVNATQVPSFFIFPDVIKSSHKKIITWLQ